eukprot:TRINITY_DN29385_c0_g1_i1.p1 TRINITY_DN29385_c0_g1~~TRINITY_DN29385_c0_g1_i1.p1  ORF type:complete len:844 (-),score=122.52 TRINITY_DN29385_c0_g1_i1:270-2543(-)
MGLVLVDNTVSLKLFRAMHGPTSLRGRSRASPWSVGIFAAHLAYRGCEVATKSAVMIALAFILQPITFAVYLALAYLINMAVLLEEVKVRNLGCAIVMAWPLLFSNLPEFVDSPKHYAKAQNAANLVCGLRALELSLALSLAVVAYLLEEEVADPQKAVAWIADPRMVNLVVTCQAVCFGTLSFTWAICVLVNYICMVTSWRARRSANPTLLAPLLPGQRSPAAISSSFEEKKSPRTMSHADKDADKDKDFWPAALGLAPLLLRAFCERAPLAWRLQGSAASSANKAGSDRGFAKLEDFDTIGLIGCGKFGKVFQVRNRATQQTFAMKRLSKDFYARMQMTDKASREIQTLNLAQENPFVVKLVHAIESVGEWAMVMEYCPGGDLQQLLLTEGCPGLPLQRTLRISAEVALALEHLHTRGIVFRDLKLENVVLDHDGFAKLTDFGLAKQYKGGRDAVAEAEANAGAYTAFTKTFCGSYGYAAPEVNPRRQEHGFAADLYAYGVLLVMMLTGGEVYHDTREAPFERRLPPESLKDLRDILSRLNFDFYWASQHLLQQAWAYHRVEIDLNGVIVIVSRGKRGRRQARPDRPPNSPTTADGSGPSRPPRFPEVACTNSEASRRRWDTAIDLVRFLTDEAPERRGTVARLKQHAFFEEIRDWRYVFPSSWTLRRVKAELMQLAGRSALPAPVLQQLEQLPFQDLVPLLDSPDDVARLLEQCAEFDRAPSPKAERTSVPGSRTAGYPQAAYQARVASAMSEP